MENTQTILAGQTDVEKGAYLSAIASIATADREASEEELEGIQLLCQSAELSEAQTQQVLQAARTPDNAGLKNSLDILKGSDLKYALVTDLISFAKIDSDYSEAEQKNVQSISAYLGLNQNQFSLLNQFTDATAQTGATPEQVTKPGFLSSLGIEDKLKSAGINTGGLLKSLLAVAAPLLLSRMLSGRRGNRGGLGGMFGGGGGLGGMFGGNTGGLGGMLGGGGGIGSVISMLNGGRGFGRAGGLLGSLLGGSRW